MSTHRFLAVVSLIVLSASLVLASPGESVINTVAGGGPNGIPARQANLQWPSNAAVDPLGRLHFTAWHRVFRLDASGNLHVVAGNGGNRGFSGDGMSALDANLYYPSGLAFDAAGNLFIADTLNGRVRRVDAATGIITTVAGGGVNDPGDGGLATAARLREPVGLALDASGNLYISDSMSGRIRRVDALTGNISTYAGGGIGSGNGVPATSIALLQPSFLAIDSTGNLFIAELGNSFGGGTGSIRRVDAGTQIITTAAAGVFFPTGLALDNAAGLLYVAAGNRVFRLDLATSILSAFAGTGIPGYGGDDGVGAVQFNFSGAESWGGLGLDGSGNLFIGDSGNHRLRRLTLANGAITRVAGTGADNQSEDGFPATKTYFDFPFSAAIDGAGNLYVAERAIRRVDAGTDLVSTATGIPAGGGAAQPLPTGSLLVDPAGNLYIATDTQILRRDALTGTIGVVAGNGTEGFSGDGGPATAAQLAFPWLGALDGMGNLYVADIDNLRVRRVDALTGLISTVAGNGSIVFSGDGGPAVNAGMNPSDVAVDSTGNLYIADARNHRVRKVDALTGMISTYAGTGVRGNGADGVLATSSALNFPGSVALDQAGNLHLTDLSLRVRRSDASTGIISTVAGSGLGGFSGDGGPATAARFDTPGALFFDTAGSFYIVDDFNFRIRKVSASAASGSPVAAAGLDFQAECASSAGASVRLDGSASSDPDSTPGTHDDIAQFEWFENYGTSNQELLGSGEVLDVSLPLGEHLITLRVTDQGGLSDTDEVEVDVAADTTGPQIVVALSPNVLSPPDHRFRPIHATVTAVDACGSVDVVLLGVTSSDAGITSNPVPSSDIRGAATGTADYDFELRAERLGAGSGRIYTVTYQAADGAGNVSNGSAEVLVPHNRPPANSSLGRAKKSLRLR